MTHEDEEEADESEDSEDMTVSLSVIVDVENSSESSASSDSSESSPICYSTPMIITQPDRILLAQQIKRFADTMTGKMLDVGSGRSRRYDPLFKNVTAITTIDTDTRGKPDIVGSAETMPIEDASFDSVLCTQVLEHVPHPVKVIAEIARVLKPGGHCLLTVPQMNELHEIPNDFFRYTNFGLKVLFEDAGFEVETIDQRGKYHSTVMQMRIRYLIDRFHPYENKFTMLILAPLSVLLTKWALMRDRMTNNEASSRHAIGWCVVARKK